MVYIEMKSSKKQLSTCVNYDKCDMCYEWYYMYKGVSNNLTQ